MENICNTCHTTGKKYNPVKIRPHGVFLCRGCYMSKIHRRPTMAEQRAREMKAVERILGARPRDGPWA